MTMVVNMLSTVAKNAGRATRSRSSRNVQEPRPKTGLCASVRVPQTALRLKASNASTSEAKLAWKYGKNGDLSLVSNFTTTLPPNTRVLQETNGKVFDVDYNSWFEGKNGLQGQPSFAAVTSRSFHAGGVNCLRADGSVDFIS